MLRHLAYVILFVEDLERSLAFYKDILGMTVRHRAEGYAELAVEGPKFALLERWRLPALVGEPESGLPPPGTHEGEVAFLVQDVDEVYTGYAAAEWLSSARPRIAPGGSERRTSGTRMGT